MRGANDNADDAGGGPFLASARALLLPVAVAALAYGLPLAGLMAAGKGDGAVARLCMAALGLALPFLVAHAVLRRATVRVDVLPHALIVHPGFPSMRQHVVPYPAVRSVEVLRGLGGRLSGTATLVVTLAGGRRLSAVGLADAEAARDSVLARLAPPEPAEAPDTAAENREIGRFLAG